MAGDGAINTQGVSELAPASAAAASVSAVAAPVSEATAPASAAATLAVAATSATAATSAAAAPASSPAPALTGAGAPASTLQASDAQMATTAAAAISAAATTLTHAATVAATVGSGSTILDAASIQAIVAAIGAAQQERAAGTAARPLFFPFGVSTPAPRQPDLRIPAPPLTLFPPSIAGPGTSTGGRPRMTAAEIRALCLANGVDPSQVAGTGGTGSGATTPGSGTTTPATSAPNTWTSPQYSPSSMGIVAQENGEAVDGPGRRDVSQQMPTPPVLGGSGPASPGNVLELGCQLACDPAGSTLCSG
jgi:trimeric autotransporter adhesin